MKNQLLAICTLCVVAAACGTKQGKNPGSDPFIVENVEFAAAQISGMVDSLDMFDHIKSPRTVRDDKIRYVRLEDWTSGFFPGSLWYLYELTGDDAWLVPAVKYTEGMEHIKHFTGNHDIGFMIFCSFGNGLRLTDKKEYEDVIITAAESLCSRFRPGAGVIQSWNARSGWTCPVIIDNMMNLELLFESTRMSGDSTYWNIAVSHADQTLKNHYRPDMGCYHVIDYDPETGEILNRHTWQGYSHESSWARGQAWGIYGYTMSYRYTKDEKYLDHAVKAADFWVNHHNLPADLVPYWDFDAPGIPDEPRDASAAAIAASALYELSSYVGDVKAESYKITADRILESLGSPAYRAELGGNGNFVLMHSVGSAPHNVEMDVPLVYADYYFLEALKRKRDLQDN